MQNAVMINRALSF